MQLLTGRRPGADVYNRRRDNIMLIVRRPLAHVKPADEWQTLIDWNQAELGEAVPSKEGLLDELARVAPPGADRSVGPHDCLPRGGALSVAQVARRLQGPLVLWSWNVASV